MDIEKYLDRIGYRDSKEPSLKLLYKLQLSHLLSIPFENLSIHKGELIELNINKLYNKIIIRRRGGFCYELNGLFYELLASLGFKVKRISAKVYSENKGYGEEFDHMALIVNIKNVEYLSDVGFGDFSFQPLKIELNLKQEDKAGIFFFDKYDNNYFRVNKLENKKVTPQYIFTTRARKLNDFDQMCNYHQTSPKSHFTANKLVTLPSKNGRITLNDYKLKKTKNKLIEEIMIKDEKDFQKYLKYYFSIEL